MELVPASSFDSASLAELFTAGYEGYSVQIRLDEPAFRTMVEVSDLDLARSRVAVVDGSPVGAAVLGVRGEEAWIGGLGVVPATRRGGVGRALTKALLAEAGSRVVRLEVIESNAPAIALYEALGFREIGKLEVWSWAGEAPPPSSAVSVPVEEAHAWIREHRSEREPWQRADGTLAHLMQLDAVALEDRGAAVFRVLGDRVSMLQLEAVDEDAAAEVLRAARFRGTALGFLNVPEGHVASRALRRHLRTQLEVRQVEMAR